MPDLVQMPSQFAAGTTVEYTLWHADYPSVTWALEVYLAGKSAAAKFTGVADGDGVAWVVTIPASETANLEPGTYTWIERVSDAGVVYDAATGSVVVTPNVATATAGQLQSFSERMLAEVESKIAARVSADLSSYTIAQRAANREAIADLMRMRAEWAEKVAAERRQGASRPQILTAFTGPGMTSR